MDRKIQPLYARGLSLFGRLQKLNKEGEDLTIGWRDA
jgi:hypothetical protein